MPDSNRQPDYRTDEHALSPAETGQFQSALLAWFDRHKRDLPWRRTRDPYAIWISEIMLQQTRVAAALPFYQRFLARFPDARSLAQAPESDLLAHWAGLGYYYRARNLQKAAQSICAASSFPATHEAIRLLPGVGEYTAAAVSSIAFGLPHAAVDGNVLRVLSRVLADGTDIASARGRKHFTAAAEKLLHPREPGAFNQAVMELGATICLPSHPQCLLCPVRELCRAHASGRQNQFPVKRARPKSVDETRSLYWIERRGELLLWQRPPHARLMPGFWELPESEHLPEALPQQLLGSFRHGITVHNYRFDVFEAAPPPELGPCRWVSESALQALPASTIFRKAQKIVERGANRLAAQSARG